jgi:hypothetical protein
MRLRHALIAVLFAVAVAFVMRYMLGGRLELHLAVAIPAALIAAAVTMRRRA